MSRFAHRVAAGTLAGVLLLTGSFLAATPVQASPVDPANPVASAAATGGNGADGPTALAAAPAAPTTLTLLSTSPIAPPVSATNTTVTVQVSITNNTDSTLQQLQLRAVRDSPIIRQSALDEELAHPAPPVDSSLTQPLPTVKYPSTLAPHATAQFSYQFSASSQVQTGGLCLCQTGIYPVDLTAYAATSDRATPTQIGFAQTYLISATSTPTTEKVSWLWPLLDHPHRLSDSTAFLDDDLATEVAAGGRLDRALQVLEQVGPTSQMTVVIDPELIDELVQMSAGYRVQDGATTVPGTGSAAAAEWLSRLRVAITDLPITLTTVGDVAENAVAAAHLASQSRMSAAMSVRVSQALGRPLTAQDSALVWPTGETLTPDAFNNLAADGMTTVVLNDTTLPGGANANPAPPAVAKVAVPDSPATSVTALVTSSPLEQRVDGLLNSANTQLAELPQLLSVLALRTLQTGASPSYVVLTPDRYIDANPATAAAVITATSQSSWSTPVDAVTAATTITPTDHGQLTSPDAAHYGGSSTLIARAASATAFMTNFSSALEPADSPGLLGDFPTAIQLCLSAGWANAADAAARYNTVFADQANQLSSMVQIVRPSNGAYSLASSNSPLLVTVVNNLPVQVTVRIAMSTIGGVAGFRTDDAGLQVIPANSRRTIKVQAHVARSGHFRVQAQLLMPAGGTFGPTLPLSIYSSALGTIGVVITVVAAAVLLLALIVRFTRRWHHHRELIRKMMTEGQQVLAGTRG